MLLHGETPPEAAFAGAAGGAMQRLRLDLARA